MKSYNIHKFFPTLFYEFRWSEAEIRPLLEETQVKKEIIKQQSKSRPEDKLIWDETDNSKNYCNDFYSQVKLLEYEKLIEEIYTTFLPELQCSHIKYWSAIYKEKAYLPVHAHIEPLFSASGINMASTLYLSNTGGTRFFNPSQIGVNDKDLYIQSEVGKMYMWPSHLLHEALPHGKKDKERFIISSNWRIQHARYGSGGTGAGSGNIN